MSNPYTDVLFGSSFQKIALVKKITEKTQQAKIVWQKTENGAAAYVPGALRMSFVEAPWALFGGKRWVIFAVRDEVGNELLKVENQSSALPESLGTPIAPPPEHPNTLLNYSLLTLSDPLVSAVTELHNVVQSQSGKAGVDKAIEFLNNM
jgi:hypothetical protein